MLKIIEKRDVIRDYGFSGVEVMVDHPKHGRLLLQDGFGGIDSLSGGAARWEHGMVHKLLDTDTFETLGEVVNEYGSTVQDCMTYGTDDTRPQLLWDGFCIASLIKSLGL